MVRPVLREGGGPAELSTRGLSRLGPEWTRVAEALTTHKRNLCPTPMSAHFQSRPVFKVIKMVSLSRFCETAAQ